MLTYSHVNAKTIEMIRENFHCAKGRNFITYSAARAELEDTGFRHVTGHLWKRGNERAYLYELHDAARVMSPNGAANIVKVDAGGFISYE